MPDTSTADPVNDDLLAESDDEVAVGELVEYQPLPDSEPTGKAHAAIEAAARAAIEQPGIPGAAEFMALAMQARMMAGSELCPKALRGKPADVMLVLLTGRDLGIPITSALRQVHVIEGTPTLAPKLRMAIIRRQGLGSVVPEWGSCAAWASAMALGPGGVDPFCKRARRHVTLDPDGHDCGCDLLGDPIVFRWQDGKAAGLVGVECYPTDDGLDIVHSDVCRDHNAKPYAHGARVKCKDNWKNYPARMVWARAAGYACDDYFPDANMGIYSPDEMGAVTDEDGRPLNPATVALPEGFEDAEKRTQGAARAAGAQSAGVSTVPVEELAALKLRANLLPEPVRVDLKRRWRESERLKPHTFDTLPGDLVNLVRSMLGGFEAVAKRQHGWDPAEAMAAHVAATAAQLPQDGPETVSAPDVAEAAADATAGDVAPDVEPETEPDEDGIVDAVVVEGPQDEFEVGDSDPEFDNGDS